DLPSDVGQVHAGIEPDAHVEGAPGRHARGPVATRDLAQHEIDRMVVAGEGWMLLRVPALLQFMQGLHQWEAALDRVGAPPGIGDMSRPAAHLDLEPHDADLRNAEPAARRLRHDGPIGAIAAPEAG